MRLWLISQNENDDHDTFDSAIVAAETEDEARGIHPDGGNEEWGRTWCSTPEQVTAKLIGEAATDIPFGVILGSFNAG